MICPLSCQVVPQKNVIIFKIFFFQQKLSQLICGLNVISDVLLLKFLQKQHNSFAIPRGSTSLGFLYVPQQWVIVPHFSQYKSKITEIQLLIVCFYKIQYDSHPIFFSSCKITGLRPYHVFKVQHFISPFNLSGLHMCVLVFRHFIYLFIIG